MEPGQCAAPMTTKPAEAGFVWKNLCFGVTNQMALQME
jgi:hypothetical protein